MKMCSLFWATLYFNAVMGIEFGAYTYSREESDCFTTNNYRALRNENNLGQTKPRFGQNQHTEGDDDRHGDGISSSPRYGQRRANGE